jgi:O-antigen/teichoic acid export membrane protein
MTRMEPHSERRGARHAAVAGRRAAGIAQVGAAVAAAGALVNVLGYVVPFFGARRLSAADLSVLATVLGLGAIASVPGLGLQTAVAVRWARNGPVPHLARTTALTAGLAGLVLVFASPVAAVTLHMSVVPPLLMAATIVAVVMASRSLGELQGAQRFRSLAAGMVVAGMARYGGVVIGLIAGVGVDGSLAIGALVAWLAVPALAVLVGRPSHVDSGAGHLRAREIVAAGGATLATLAISYADLVLARGLLPAAESGAYAVGAVLTKGALWAPQVVTVLALPQLAKGRRGALRIAVGLVALCGAGLVLAAGLFGNLAMRLAGGPAYAHLGPYAGRFAAVGALYALVFVFVNAEIAAGVRRPAAPLWFALLGLGVLARFVVPHTVGGILTASLVTASVTFVMMAVMARSRWRA